MNLGARRLAGVVTAGLLILVAGCTSSTADGPATTSIVSLTVTPSVIDPSSLHPSTSAPPSSPSPSAAESPTSTSLSSDISPQEAADRAAIEAQWAEFWRVYNNIVRTPSDQRSAVLDQVSIDPIKGQILAAAQRFESEGIDYYGSVLQHPYWKAPVNGQSFAVMRDCQDQSAYGSEWVATGEARSIGVSKNNLQAGFIRGEDGVWRVRTFDHLSDEPC